MPMAPSSNAKPAAAKAPLAGAVSVPVPAPEQVPARKAVSAPPASPRSPGPIAPPAADATLAVPFPAPAAANPASAAAALERIRAAYEYGDIDEVVDWSRQVTEGRLHSTAQERARALRYLGIGLFLTGRTEGAEAAFFELLRARPDVRLDPKTTRPDVVAFFEQVRQRHAQEIQIAARDNNPKSFLRNFLPPLGQFQNGQRARGMTIGALEMVSLGTMAATYAILKSWEHPGHTFPGREDDARALKFVNYVSLGVLAATYLFGVIDGIAHYPDSPAEDPSAPPPTATNLSLGPTGLTLEF
jgi:hypothetical protein